VDPPLPTVPTMRVVPALDVVPRPWRAESSADRRTWLALATIAVLAVLLRLFVSFVLHPTCDPVPELREEGCFIPGADTYYYSEQGRLLADGHLFVTPNEVLAGVPDDELGPGAQHPPLFPVVLGVASAVGLDTQDDHRGVTAFLGGIGVLLLGLVGWRIAGRRAALLAAGLAAVAPQLWLNDDVAMS
jgi:hypothetical protein